MLVGAHLSEIKSFALSGPEIITCHPNAGQIEYKARDDK